MDKKYFSTKGFSPRYYCRCLLFYRDRNSENCFVKLHLKTKAVTDIVHDKITTIDKRIDLYFSTRRHYWIDIYPNKTEKEKHEKVLILQDLTKKEKIANYQNK